MSANKADTEDNNISNANKSKSSVQPSESESNQHDSTCYQGTGIDADCYSAGLQDSVNLGPTFEQKNERLENYKKQVEDKLYCPCTLEQVYPNVQNMPGVDWIPGVAQLKSVCQFMTGDFEGAARTQQNFFQECPVVSQTVATVQLIAGDEKGAEETFKKGFGTINNVANGIPVVGHVKGVIHHAVGDHEGGNEALNAATRSTVVLATGAVAGIATGGLAAIPAGIAAGGTYDITDSVINDKPKGFVAAVANVVDNPSAGSVFDAAAILVGDGLAGRAGGKLGANIVKEAKIGRLEAVRDAKLAAMDEASTSGQALSIGKQINALTSEINTLRHGTPKFWFDPKTNQIVMKRNGVVVPVPGYAEGGEQEKNDGRSKQPNKQRGSSSSQQQQTTEEFENGLQADWYSGEIMSGLQPAQREQKRQAHAKQQAGSTTIQAKYPTSTIANENEANQMRNDSDQNHDPRRNLNRTNLELLAAYKWIPLRMPPEFGYTAATKLNNSFQGLLHSFVRHGDQWVEQIPGLSEVMERLSPIRRHLDSIRNAANSTDSGNAINAMNDALQLMDNETFIAIQSAFYEAQWAIHQHLQANVTSAQYLEEGITDRGQVQVYFKVRDSKGNVRVMVVCVSKELFPSIREFNDSRPVRTVTTVYFISWDEFQNLNLRAGKSWKK